MFVNPCTFELMISILFQVLHIFDLISMRHPTQASVLGRIQV
jgi:hypothetical protein